MDSLARLERAAVRGSIKGMKRMDMVRAMCTLLIPLSMPKGKLTMWRYYRGSSNPRVHLAVGCTRRAKIQALYASNATTGACSAIWSDFPSGNGNGSGNRLFIVCLRAILATEDTVMALYLI